MKSLARQELERRKAQAVRFTRAVLGDDDRADEIEGESLDDYAERKRIRLANPQAYFARITFGLIISDNAPHSKIRKEH